MAQGARVPQPAIYSAEAYAARQEALSPDELRDAATSWMEPHLGKEIADLGSGAGGWVRHLRDRQPRAQIRCIDIVDAGASQVPGIASFHLADLSRDRLPFPDESIDAVTAIEVIEHVPNPRHMVAEAARVLRPGGSIWLTTPSCDSLRAKISMALRGYWPSCCEHDYRVSGHIAGLTELDLERMGAEVRLEVSFEYLTRGSLPASSYRWPIASRLTTDTTFCRMHKR